MPIPFIPVIIWLVFDNVILVIGAAVLITLAPKFVVKHLRKKRLEAFERELGLCEVVTRLAVREKRL